MLQAFAAKLTASFFIFCSRAARRPTESSNPGTFIATGRIYGMAVEAPTESPVDEVGRPDLGVAVNRLLTGHIELKAPGKGARPDKFKGADKNQWEKFKSLPNLIYTDGCQWALYRTGKREGKLITLSGDPTVKGAGAVTAVEAQKLEKLIRDFLNWNPIVPITPRASFGHYACTAL